MRIRVINPNTTWSMTRLDRRVRVAVAAPRSPSRRCHADDGSGVDREPLRRGARACPASSPRSPRGEAEGVDGYVIACFGDPGLEAARELARGPVVGIAEAAYARGQPTSAASFSVVTTLDRTRGRAWDLASTYGVETACRGVHACEIPVLELETIAGCAGADHPGLPGGAGADESDVIVLGCAGMADLLRAHLRRRSASRSSTAWRRRSSPSRDWSGSGCARAGSTSMRLRRPRPTPGCWRSSSWARTRPPGTFLWGAKSVCQHRIRSPVNSPGDSGRCLRGSCG